MGIAFQLVRGFWGDRVREHTLFFLIGNFFNGLAKVFRENEQVTGPAEGFRGLFFTETVDNETCLTDTRCQPREIAVAGYQAEPVESCRYGVDPWHR